MGSTLLLFGIVFAAALVLLLAQPRDGLRITVVAAAGIELLLATGILHLDLRGVPLREILAAILAVVGAILWFRVTAKTMVTAAAVVTLVGALELLSALRVLR